MQNMFDEDGFLGVQLSATLLKAWDLEYTVEGELWMQDALRLDLMRQRRNRIESVCISLDRV